MTNQELVAERLRVSRAKREARRKAVATRQERQLQLRQQLQQSSNTLVAVKVHVDPTLRQVLKLSGKERRGRIFVESTVQFSELQQTILEFFTRLRKGTFVLSSNFGVSAPEEATPSAAERVQGQTTVWKDLTCDAHVREALDRAMDLYKANQTATARPTLFLRVAPNPDGPPLTDPIPLYHTNLPNPNDSPTITMLSFYGFTASSNSNSTMRIDDPEDLAQQLRRAWKPLGVRGRVYVATEGVNAQMSCPSNVLDSFVLSCEQILSPVCRLENGINIDPVPLTPDEFAVAGMAAGGKPAPPFTGLHVRVRGQIVADGLLLSADDDTGPLLDWQSAGYDMHPLEWHEKLKNIVNKSSTSERVSSPDDDDKEKSPIVLDCRNTYETEVGRFEGAEPLNTENFRDTWGVLEERLKDTPKDTPILGYCTGGIRCVKVGAYLTQKMGFTNVSRLAGGIIAYDRTLQEEAPTEKPLFQGTNFVFDGRLGRPITEHTLAKCITCGTETSLVSNCNNENCHQRMVQCETCRTEYLGTCSSACRQRFINGATRSSTESVGSMRTFESLEDYSNGHSTPPPSVYNEISLSTKTFLATGSHMISGSQQGRLLKQFASMTREGRILEVGTFTGYATACFLEGAYSAATTGEREEIGTRKGGPYVLSMERDSQAYSCAVAHMQAIAECDSFDIPAAEAVCSVRANGSILPVEEESVTFEYRNSVTCELWRVTDALAVVEELADGQTRDGPDVSPFDLVFLDADKTRLRDYIEACASSNMVLKKGGIVVVDNVLWKGLVLDVDIDEPLEQSNFDIENMKVEKKRKRSRKLAATMHEFNNYIVQDGRFEVLVMPIRDGLSVLRKR